MTNTGGTKQQKKKFALDFNVKEIAVIDYENNKMQEFVEVVRCKDCKHNASDTTGSLRLWNRRKQGRSYF